MKNRSRLKKKLTRSQIISRIMYLAALLCLLSVIPASASIFYDYYTQTGSHKGYHAEELYDSFIYKEYGDLIQKVDYNIGIGLEPDEDTINYYAFAQCYDSAMDYHMYEKTGQTELAKEALSTFKENEGKLNRRIFTDALESVKETYEIP